MPNLGKVFIFSGIVLISIGLLYYLFGKIPFLGKLPGDIYIERKNFIFYFPLATCILLSLLFILIFRFFSRR
ncbi:MAG: DUF2905 domain-containing protein [Candidatus Aminicenantes bacterium]|nr:DUF2905 domain-containing protein [Candidatus Aminicenantes bacterium]